MSIVSKAGRSLGLVPLPLHPTTAHGEDLADKTASRLAAEIGCELGIFLRSGEAHQKNLSLQALLESRIE